MNVITRMFRIWICKIGLGEVLVKPSGDFKIRKCFPPYACGSYVASPKRDVAPWQRRERQVGSRSRFSILGSFALCIYLYMLNPVGIRMK